MDNEKIGGGLYAQGDLLNEDGSKFNYNEKNKLYHFTSLGDGKYEGVFRTQDRANLINADNRAGLYFTILNKTYRAVNVDHRFVTPKEKDFTKHHNPIDELRRQIQPKYFKKGLFYTKSVLPDKTVWRIFGIKITLKK